MQPFDCFRLYLAVKMHFKSPTYDYQKYLGKVNVKEDTFNKRKDKWFFVKLAKTFAEEDMLDLVVSNFLENDNVYVTHLLNAEAKDIMLDYKQYDFNWEIV